MLCRHCHEPLVHTVIDLGSAPLSNAFLSREDLDRPEKWLPLRVFVCNQCWLVQTNGIADRDDIFRDDYAYFSSYSSTWVEHARQFVLDTTNRFGLGKDSFVTEVAANDGYLLQHVKALGIPCLGIEPTASTANAARSKGIEIVQEFFGIELAKKLASSGTRADLVVANNVFAHVPNVNDFAAGFAILLKPGGVATFEFPHVQQLVLQNQFDTIYHEHYSYLSLTAAQAILRKNGLEVFDVDKLSTHGGSLRLYAQRSSDGQRAVSDRVLKLLREEQDAGIKTVDFYQGLQARAETIKDNFISYLTTAKRAGKMVVGYGAAAKGNTLLNFAGVRPDLLPFVVDRNPAKQGRYLPGSRIPIVGEDQLRKARPNDIVILAWNLKTEIMQQLAYAGGWNARFVTAIPELTIEPSRMAVAAESSGQTTSRRLEANSTTTRIPYTKPSITEVEVALATDAARNGWGTRCYDYITRFERDFRSHIGTEFAIATSSCTGALHMGLAALGVGRNDEVIVADTNWIATVAPIVHLGAIPVFVDILEDSWCIDPQLAERAITPRTKAIIAVHLYGNLCVMEPLLELGSRYGIPVIEDAAEAIGSTYHGRHAGSMGRFGTFSFHGTKTMTTGEGGMFVCNDVALYEKVLTLSNHGRANGEVKQFWPERIGYKYKLSNVQAAIGCGQLQRVEELVGRKRWVFSEYQRRLQGIPGIHMNPEPAGTTIGAWMPTAVFGPETKVTRETLRLAFHEANIDARVFFYPLSSLPPFQPRPENVIARDICSRAINLPSYHDMTEHEIDRVVAVILDCLKR